MSFVISKILSISLLLASSTAFISNSYAAEKPLTGAQRRALKRAEKEQPQLPSLPTVVEDNRGSAAPVSVSALTAIPAGDLGALESIASDDAFSCTTTSATSMSVLTAASAGMVEKKEKEEVVGAVNATVEIHSSVSVAVEAASVASPSALEELATRLTAGADRYSQERLGNAASFTLPHALTIKPYTASSDREFNDFYSLVADRFYQYGIASESPGSYPFATRRQNVMSWLSAEILKMTDQKKALDDQIAARTDGVLGGLQAASESLGTKIDNYGLLINEALFHLGQTQQFMGYASNAVQVLKGSVSELEELAKAEKNAETRSAYEKTAETQRLNIGKFKAQILSAEALMHAAYPFHRAWVPMFWGVISVPSWSANTDRLAVTGISALPASFSVSHEMLMDNAGDAEVHYQRYLQAMLSDDAFKLAAAKTHSRVVFEAAPQIAAAAGVEIVEEHKEQDGKK